MRARRRRAAAASICAAAILALGASSASGRSLTTGFYEPLYGSPQPSARATAFNETVAERAKIVRINVSWNDVAPSRPADPTNPADPAYRFGLDDAAVRDARAHHLKVMLTIQNAPAWAEGRGRRSSAPAGSWKPNARAFGAFAQAVARRYSGGFAGLPRVRFFQAWSEENLSLWLNPQWTANDKPASPRQYRRMLNAFYAGVNRGQHGAKVVTGGLAPFGDRPGGARMPPIVFLRSMLCLNSKLKPTCRAKSHFDILAVHPVDPTHSPLTHARNRKDVAVPDMGRARRVLRAAERAGHVRPRHHHPLWVTELLWITKPPSRYGISLRAQARFIEQAFYVLWKEGVSVVMNFEVRDQKYDRGNPGASVQSGTYFYSGQKKPSFRTFLFPFIVPHRSGHRVTVWAKAPRRGKLKIQGARKGGWRTLKTLHVQGGKVISVKLNPRGAPRLRGAVGGITSLPWRTHHP